MIRVVQIALLLAIVIPLGMVMRYGVDQLHPAAMWFGAGIPAGMWISFLLDKWDTRIRQREGGKRAD